jgi:hypothetical protein
MARGVSEKHVTSNLGQKVSQARNQHEAGTGKAVLYSETSDEF